MKSLFIILLAGCSVRSDVNNYYVIEMQDVPPTQSPKGDIKPFNVYWNVPTMQCASKHIHFENLFENFGIIQNDKDRFKGEKVTILYDPGLFPALFKNESGGKIRFRNGGVPQEGNLNKHLDEFKKELDRSVPDKKFSGIGIIDFESWRPQFRQNFGVLQPYKDVSFEIERKLHWWWKEAWIKDEAKRRFEESARTFMQSTLSVANKLRPLARWGFYGFPYCFNMASNNLVETCANGVPKENDEISWLWSESSALFPSVYSSAQLSAAQLAALVRGRLREAARVAPPRAVILPYFWFRYRDAGFLTETDLSTALSMLYKSAASGIIVWGSSNDVNTVEKCTRLKHYVQNVLGPAIARYTKPTTNDNDDIEDITKLITDTEKPAYNLVSNIDIDLDPEFHWMPPENYTQDLKDDVEEQMSNRFSETTTTNDDNSSVLQNNSVLINLILSEVLNSVDNATTTTDNPKTKYDKKNQYQTELIDSTTEINGIASTSTSQVMSSLVTNNPLLNETNNTSTKLEPQTTEVASSEVPIFDVTSTTEKFVLETEKTETALRKETETIDSVNETTTTAKPNTDNDYDATLDEDDDDDFYNSDAFILFFNQEKTVTVEDHTIHFDENNIDITKNEKKIQTHTTDTETSGENVTIPTTDESDILKVSSTEFNDTESVSENNNLSKEVTNGNEYNTESNTISVQTTEYEYEDITYSTIIESSIKTKADDHVVYESSTNNELNDAKRSNKYESNNSELTTTSTSSNIIGISNLLNETRNVRFETDGLEVPKTTESKYKATEATNTSTAPETSTISGSEDTDVSTSIVPSTEQVVVY